MSDITMRELAKHSGPSVSVTLPTDRTGVDKAKGPKILKRLLNELPEEAHLIQELIEAYVEQNDVWRHSQEGLLIFATDSDVTMLRTAYTPDDTIYYGDTFSLIQLVPQLKQEDFIVLSLFQDGVRAVASQRGSLSKIELPGVPTSFDSFIPVDDGRERDQQIAPQRAASNGNGGRREGTFHGHGVTSSLDRHVEAYVRTVAREVDVLLYRRHPGVPVLLNTDHSYVSTVRRELSRSHVFDTVEHGNHRNLSDESLVELVRPIVDVESAKVISELTKEHQSKADQGVTVTDEEEATRAIFEGRCDQLVIGSAELEPGSELDMAIWAALQTGSEIVYLPELSYPWVVVTRY